MSCLVVDKLLYVAMERSVCYFSAWLSTLKFVISLLPLYCF